MNATALRGVSIFAELSAENLDALAGGLRRRRFARGQVIMLQGDPGATLCIVEEGRVRISVSAEDGKELVLRLLGPGDGWRARASTAAWAISRSAASSGARGAP